MKIYTPLRKYSRCFAHCFDGNTSRHLEMAYNRLICLYNNEIKSFQNHCTYFLLVKSGQNNIYNWTKLNSHHFLSCIGENIGKSFIANGDPIFMLFKGSQTEIEIRQVSASLLNETLRFAKFHLPEKFTVKTLRKQVKKES